MTQQTKERLTFGLKDVIQIIVIVGAMLAAYYTSTSKYETRLGVLENKLIERDKTMEEIRHDTKSLVEQFNMLYRDYDLRRR